MVSACYAKFHLVLVILVISETVIALKLERKKPLAFNSQKSASNTLYR